MWGYVKEGDDTVGGGERGGEPQGERRISFSRSFLLHVAFAMGYIKLAK